MKRQQNTRERLLEESAGCCIYCGHPLTLETMEADHIVPRSKGGSSDFSNRVCSCPSCNSAKADKDVMDFINSMPHRKQRAYENRLMSLFEQGRLDARKWDLLDPVIPRAQTDKVAECPAWQIFCYLCGEFY